MTVLNQVQKFIEKQGISRYRFWKQTGLGRDTAYRLCNDSSYIPTGSVLDKICETYKIQPGEILVWMPTDTDSRTALERADQPLLEQKNKTAESTDNKFKCVA